MILTWITTMIYTYTLNHIYKTYTLTPTSFSFDISQYLVLQTPLLWTLFKMIHTNGVTG